MTRKRSRWELQKWSHTFLSQLLNNRTSTGSRHGDGCRRYGCWDSVLDLKKAKLGLSPELKNENFTQESSHIQRWFVEIKAVWFNMKINLFPAWCMSSSYLCFLLGCVCLTAFSFVKDLPHLGRGIIFKKCVKSKNRESKKKSLRAVFSFCVCCHLPVTELVLLRQWWLHLTDDLCREQNYWQPQSETGWTEVQK